jgi:hypothetical protein
MLFISDAEADNAASTHQPLTLSVRTDTAASRENNSPSIFKEGEGKSTKTNATFKPTRNAALQADFDIQSLTSHLPVTFDKLRTVSQKDKLLQTVKRYIKANWPDLKTLPAPKLVSA